jgi:hypothetical protein
MALPPCLWLRGRAGTGSTGTGSGLLQRAHGWRGTSTPTLVMRTVTRTLRQR